MFSCRWDICEFQLSWKSRGSRTCLMYSSSGQTSLDGDPANQSTLYNCNEPISISNVYTGPWHITTLLCTEPISKENDQQIIHICKVLANRNTKKSPNHKSVWDMQCRRTAPDQIKSCLVRYRPIRSQYSLCYAFKGQCWLIRKNFTILTSNQKPASRALHHAAMHEYMVTPCWLIPPEPTGSQASKY